MKIAQLRNMSTKVFQKWKDKTTSAQRTQQQVQWFWTGFLALGKVCTGRQTGKKERRMFKKINFFAKFLHNINSSHQDYASSNWEHSIVLEL